MQDKSTTFATPIPDLPSGFAEWFWSHVEKTETCWLWAGNRNPHGYGRVPLGDRRYLAHRIAWTLAHGPLESQERVLHHCDNPPCQRPSHLFKGTAKDNSQDMVCKGRAAVGDCNGARKHNHRLPHGSLSPHAKITEAIAAEIRRRHCIEGISRVTLGRTYGISRTSVDNIINRKTWKLV